MQSTAAQFIQVRVHLVFLLSQIEIPRLQPFCHWCGCCSAEERGPRSRSCPRQGPVNDVAYHGTCEDQLRNPQTAEVCFSVSHAGRDSSSGAKFDPESNRLLQCRLCRLATTQHHSAPGSHQRCCESKKCDHISTLIRDELRRLRIGERIGYMYRFKLS